MTDHEQVLYEVKNTTYITSIPIEEFENIEDLKKFVKVMNANKIGVELKDEHSNLHQGVLVEIFDKQTISKTVAEELLKQKEDKYYVFQGSSIQEINKRSLCRNRTDNRKSRGVHIPFRRLLVNLDEER